MSSTGNLALIRITTISLSIIIVILSAGCSSEVNIGGTTGGNGELGCPSSKITIADGKEFAGSDEQKFNADMAQLDADLKDLEVKQEINSLNCTL